MAYRYLLMFYAHTLLVSIQLRSQYHKKNQVPWCWNHIFGWLSSIWSVQFHCFFFSVHPQFKKNDMIFYLIGKLRCFFPSVLPLLNIIWFLSTGLPPSQKRLWMPGFRFEQNKCFHMLYMVKIGHIYIYTYVQPSDYLGIHAYIPVYTYHLLIHEPQGPRYQIQLWRLHDYTKQEENQFQDNRFEGEQTIN